jgi:hypothetical protein
MVRDIKEKQFEIDSKKLELDFIKKQFLIECKRFAAQQIEGRVRQAISSHAQTALALGKKGLKPIKKQVNEMMESVSDLVDATVNLDDIWLHTNETLIAECFPENHYAINDSGGPDILNSAIKKLLSPTGELLLAHDLDTSENWKTIDGDIIFGHELELSQEMRQCIQQYNERFNELAKLVCEFELLSSKNSGSDALELWDSL